ncbi:hypothetical protein L1987_53838 [Smallanthus sonchifolius]|uniref:Uncharacterized protein n=1 Tax=Smallanthus sonchifolius TaxID=185202 RepID=A0ACB9EXC2_9ASTR|nr:hypothetical protein L1987_53838 [Smallanthus sonchifolius]
MITNKKKRSRIVTKKIPRIVTKKIPRIQTKNRSRIKIEEDEHDDDSVRREWRDVLRLRLREVASRAASRHSRILDWAKMLIGLEDQSIEFRLQVPGNDDDAYVGIPGDYVDATGYETLLQTLVGRQQREERCAAGDEIGG